MSGKARRNVGFIVAMAAGMAISSIAGAAVVNNPSFEVGVAVSSTPIATTWSYDDHSFVTAENGITPAAGQRMLKFLNTSWGGPGGVVCDVFQAIDLTSPADQALITAGGAVLTASALFNRVLDNPVPSVVDTRFRVSLYATTSFANAQSLTNIGSNAVLLDTDSNLATWEQISTPLVLPTATQWVVLHLSAIENIVDDNTALEFHGHYADDVRLTLTPAPGSLALLGVGGVLSARRRRK